MLLEFLSLLLLSPFCISATLVFFLAQPLSLEITTVFFHHMSLWLDTKLRLTFSHFHYNFFSKTQTSFCRQSMSILLTTKWKTRFVTLTSAASPPKKVQFSLVYEDTMKATLALFLVLLTIGFSEAGFRCFFGDWACSSGCKVLGQSSGTCDDDGKCW